MKNSSDIIWLTTVEGNAYFSKSEIVLITETKIPFKSGEETRAIKSKIYIRGNEDPFLVMESPEEILERMFHTELQEKAEG